MLELAEYFGREGGPARIVIRQKIGRNDFAAMAGIARENVKTNSKTTPCRSFVVPVPIILVACAGPSSFGFRLSFSPKKLR
jgi:hypothetical protein